MGKVMVVDDEAGICEVLEKFLVAKNHDVYTAFDGRTALRKVKEIRPQVVLLDVALPGMDGMEVLQEIRRIDPTIGVVMVTGLMDHNQARKTLELGAYDYVTKPVDFSYLDYVINAKMIDLTG
jgi:two-component system response regulator (stage 0 sporulation protein F)